MLAFQESHNLAGLRKAMGLCLGVANHVIDDDIELAPAAWRDHRVHAKSLLDLSGHPGCFWLVVSHLAVKDLNLHKSSKKKTR